MSISVLFIGKYNASLSLVAEALLNQLCKGEFEAVSAGIEPGEKHGLVDIVLSEKRIDSTSLHPKPVSTFESRVFDYIIVLSDTGEPVEVDLPSARKGQYAWTFPAPAQMDGALCEVLVAFRRSVIELSMRLALLMIITRREAPAVRELVAA